MAHNLESMAYNSKNGKPWHELGTAVDGLMTSADAINLAGLNWTVEKRQVNQTLPDGSNVVIPNTFALARNTDNRVLGMGSGRYTPIQNPEAFLSNITKNSDNQYNATFSGNLINPETDEIFVLTNGEMKIKY